MTATGIMEHAKRLLAHQPAIEKAPGISVPIGAQASVDIQWLVDVNELLTKLVAAPGRSSAPGAQERAERARALIAQTPTSLVHANSMVPNAPMAQWTTAVLGLLEEMIEELTKRDGKAVNDGLLFSDAVRAMQTALNALALEVAPSIVDEIRKRFWAVVEQASLGGVPGAAQIAREVLARRLAAELAGVLDVPGVTTHDRIAQAVAAAVSAAGLPPAPPTIRSEFEVHRLNADGLDVADQIAQAFSRCLSDLDATGRIAKREWDLVVERMQEACFWAKRGVAIFPEYQAPTITEPK